MVLYLKKIIKEKEMKNSLMLKETVILYCEDDISLRDITANILKQFVKKLYLADNGADGLKIFEEHKDEIEIIITDINMPKMNGLEMVKEIKKINQNIPIIITTAFSDSSYLIEAINIGIDKYVLKPIDIKNLLNAMDKSLLFHELQDLYKDSLTHLPNRNKIVTDEKLFDKMSLILIDIDDFSILNELYGDKNGDKILVAFSQKIKEFFKEDFNIYRVGADQFAVIDKDLKYSVKDLKNMCENLIKNVNDNGILIDNDTQILFSITIAIAQTNDKKTYEAALRALNYAKQKFIQLMVYDPKLHDTHKDYEFNMQWIKKLRSGLNDGHFKAFFQPIVDTKTKKPFKYEALIRYIDDNGEVVSPGVFLPIAKKAKLFSGIIKVMVKECFNFVKEKKKNVSINLSFEDLRNPDTLEYILEQLENHKDYAKYISFELLETEEIKDFALVRDFIDKAHLYGCKIGVDDFGAGYSNFNMLEELNVDFIKIDGSLIKKIDIDENQEIIVDTIVSFSKKTGIKTVAEFVSSETIFEKIASLGIDLAQGFYFGKPIPEGEVE